MIYAFISKQANLNLAMAYFLHLFTDSLRDRLRAIQHPSDTIDQIRGCSIIGAGQAYGVGYGHDRKWE